eukprot:TRINITY_DN9640_c0_g1_i2.p1 TRINITY_DN9640_c0_g1~~TRINITY_DN9640_c0_g1_i2.p1  ORF type:complete len:144 (-),score=16.20 TRINITY_DN9640_c0_g1_i2:200-631(-)
MEDERARRQYHNMQMYRFRATDGRVLGDGGRALGEEGEDMGTYEELLERFGDGGTVTGADEQAIMQLPTRTITPRSAREMPEDRGTCSVCLCSYCEDGEEELIRTLPCLHSFHAACIDHWLGINSTCPVCKTEINQFRNPSQA